MTSPAAMARSAAPKVANLRRPTVEPRRKPRFFLAIKWTKSASALGIRSQKRDFLFQPNSHLQESEMATSSDYMKRLAWAGIKTVDAKEDLPVHITKADTRHSVPGSTKHCVLADKLTKSIGIKEANIFNRVAHLLMYDEVKKKYVSKRFSLDQKTRDAIQTFDSGKPFPEGTYVFHPLTRSERKVNKKRRDQKRKTRPSGKGNGLQSPRIKGHLRRYEGLRISPVAA